jgi:1-deoxy-D-xylulose-5-phosphate reductoisomerase
MAGNIINKLLKKYQTSLIPIDSEHSAIFYLINHYQLKNINKIILTASGGPFLKNYKKNPTIQEALNHPNWKMGKKITIDSATMMNKGLEIIEAHYLFKIPYSKIEVVIHPQSIMHSLIETIDGMQYAQLGSTDMKHPILNALSHPKLISNSFKKFNLVDHSKLEFYSPDFKKFPMLKLAYQCGEKEENYPTVMNAANEESVNLFLNKKIPFKNIYCLTNYITTSYKSEKIKDIEGIIELNKKIKIQTREQRSKFS